MASRELPAPTGLERHVACVWEREPGPGLHIVLPDACVDVVWGGGELLLAGPATGPVLSPLTGGRAIGVRFRIGAAGAALGLPASELLDLTVPLEDVWGADARRIAEQVGPDPTPEALARAVGERLRAAREPDRAVRAAAAGGPARLDVGERQLRRRFGDAVGYGPRTLQRVLRFQRFLALAGDRRAGRPDLARLALDAGYADQAHLTRECRRLSGVTPAALLATGAGPAGDPTVSFNTPRPGAATLAA